jgi:putative transposase
MRLAAVHAGDVVAIPDPSEPRLGEVRTKRDGAANAPAAASPTRPATSVTELEARVRPAGPHRRIVAGRRYRLVLSDHQESRLVAWGGALRALWNAALEQRRTAWRSCGATVGYAEQCRDLTDARAELAWLCDVPAQAAQQTLRDLARAFERFFEGVGRYPRFRSRRHDPGIRIPQGVEIRRVNRRFGEARLPKVGWVRFRWTRPPGGRIRYGALSRDALGWHLSLCVELEASPARQDGGLPIGVDRGIAVLAATSDGELVSHDFWSLGERRRRRVLERRLARQQRGSRRKARTAIELARLRARVARRRRDALHKLSSRLATGHSMIAVEDLDVRAMTRSARGTPAQPGRNVRAKAGLNREILERGWGELRRQLAYKCDWYGSLLVEVDPRHTSQTCSICHTVDPASRESRALFRCRGCGHTAHADINAARVILARALKPTAGGPSVAARGGLAEGLPRKREPALQEAARQAPASPQGIPAPRDGGGGQFHARPRDLQERWAANGSAMPGHDTGGRRDG